MKIFDELYERYPQLKGCEGEIAKAFDVVRQGLAFVLRPAQVLGGLGFASVFAVVWPEAVLAVGREER